ncbi:hypothetical protein D3C83_39260 [compost metagenome]
MRRQRPRFVRHAEISEGARGVLHHVPIVGAAHDDADQRFAHSAFPPISGIFILSQRACFRLSRQQAAVKISPKEPPPAKRAVARRARPLRLPEVPGDAAHQNAKETNQ